MNRYIQLKHLLILIIVFTTITSYAFQHPGIMHTQSDLDFVKLKINSGQEPWKSIYNDFVASKYASLDYIYKPVEKVICSSYNKLCSDCTEKGIGCDAVLYDGNAAYSLALRWFFSDDERYAQKSIEVMMAWADKFIVAEESNARLISSAAITKHANAAEILRYNYSGWTQEHTDKVNKLLNNFKKNLFWEDKPNNNWMTISIEGRMSIAIFQDDQAAFDDAVEKWKFRVKSYVYQQSDNWANIIPPGNIGEANKTLAQWWHPQHNPSIDGWCMETCRDMNHSKMGFNALINGAEIAWSQGIDLFTTEQKRIKDFIELHGSWFLGTPVPNAVCGGQLDFKGTVEGAQNAFEIAYNHLHDRLGIEMPNAKKMIENKRPKSIGMWIDKWESLTYAERPFAIGPFFELSQNFPDTLGYDFENITINVSDIDTKQDISYVELYIDNQLVATDRSEPFAWSATEIKNLIKEISCGLHNIDIRVYNAEGEFRRKDFSFLLADCSCIPCISFANLSENVVLSQNDLHTVLLEESGNVDKIKYIDFFIDNKLVSRKNTFPFIWKVSDFPEKMSLLPGEYIFTAVAEATSGLTATKHLTVAIENAVFNVPGNIETAVYFNTDGGVVQKSTDPEGGINTLALDRGKWTQYICNIDFSGDYVVSYRVASTNSEIDINLYQDTKYIKNLNANSTIGSHEWTTYYDELSLDEGQHKLRIVSVLNDLKINWIDLKAGYLPKVDVVVPSADTTVYNDYRLYVKALATDKEGSIKQLALYIDDDLVRIDSEGPFEWGLLGSETENELNGKSSGIHTIKIIATDNDGHTHQIERQFTVEEGLGINLLPNNLVSIAPNPTTGYFSVSSKAENISNLYIYDLVGTLVYKAKIDAQQAVINSKLNQGVYFVKIEVGKYQPLIKKIIVE